MISFFSSRRRAERFAQLLDEANGGRRHHARSRLDEELAELLTIGQGLATSTPEVRIDPAYRTSLRAMIVATAEREGIDVGARTVVATPIRPARRPSSVAINGQRIRARGAILAGIAAGAIAISGISAASDRAVPGDALYGMKRSAERAQLALASSDHSRGQLFLDFARTRLTEAEALRGDVDSFSAALEDMDNDTRRGIRLLTESAMRRGDQGDLDTVDAFTAKQQRSLSRLLDTELSQAQRERVNASLTLLGSAQRRSDELRIALLCDAPQPTRQDSLGPQPQSCPSLRITPDPPEPSKSPQPRQTDQGKADSTPTQASQTAQPTSVPSLPGQGRLKPAKPSSVATQATR